VSAAGEWHDHDEEHLFAAMTRLPAYAVMSLIPSLASCGLKPERAMFAPARGTLHPPSEPTERALTVPPVPPPRAPGNPLRGMRFWVDPSSLAMLRARALRASDPETARLFEQKIARFPTGIWLGDRDGDIQRRVDRVLTSAASRGEVPILVLDNLPLRDCAPLSGDSAAAGEEYRRWVRRVHAGLGQHASVVILEPDAVSMLEKKGCLTALQREQRVALLRDAIRVLRQNPKTVVYLDGGHSRWLPVDVQARLLRACGVEEAHGFALNVRNYRALEELIPFGQQLSELLGGAHFVIDTSRNGAGPLGVQWCNPPGRKLGVAPTLDTAIPQLIDAYLWLKRPGEADGACHGAPGAGVFLDEQARELLEP
jgi:endoglucanase